MGFFCEIRRVGKNRNEIRIKTRRIAIFFKYILML